GELAASRPLLVGHLGFQGREQRLELLPRLPFERAERAVPPLPELLLLAAQALGHQLVLGGEVAVEAHLGGTGLRRDHLDTDAANAAAVEEVARGLANALACAGPLRLVRFLSRGLRAHGDRISP